MKRAIYPGSFDPVTNGHLDVVERARKLFDEVIVAVAYNDEKQPLFPLKERLDLLQQTVGKIDNVRIAQFDGLLVEFALQQKANAVIRGLRAVSDFEFEFQMALMNRKLEGNVETIFLMPKEEYTYLSSRLVKEIARLGGDVSKFVPSLVASALGKNLKDKLRKDSQVKVHLKQIPPEGLHLEGEEDCLIPELEAEGVRCVGPMQYKIDIGVSEGSLWANGLLKQPVELTCVACLEKFVHDIKV